MFIPGVEEGCGSAWGHTPIGRVELPCRCDVKGIDGFGARNPGLKAICRKPILGKLGQHPRSAAVRVLESTPHGRIEATPIAPIVTFPTSVPSPEIGFSPSGFPGLAGPVPADIIRHPATKAR